MVLFSVKNNIETQTERYYKYKIKSDAFVMQHIIWFLLINAQICVAFHSVDILE